MVCICINPKASNEADFTDTLKLNRSKYLKNVIFSHLNINSIRNKFENLKEAVRNQVDILVIAETKIDKSFPMAQFIIEGFHKPLRLNISDKSGGLLVYVRSYLLSRQLTKFEIPSDIQAVPFEVNIRKEKWSFLCIYQPPSMNSQYFLDSLSNIIHYYYNIHGNHRVICDFNLEPSQIYLETFMKTHNYFNLIKNNTCFKGPGSCMDLILTNRKYFFQGTSSLFILYLKAHLRRKNLNKLSIVIISTINGNTLTAT